MVEAEPVNVTLTADTGDLVDGLAQGDSALRTFGRTADDTSFRLSNVTGQSRGLFRAFVEMRVALFSTERVMKLMGVSSKETTDIMNALNIVMDIGVSVMAIYRAAKIAMGLASWFAAKAGFAEAAAEESVATAGFGMPVAVLEGTGAIATFSALVALARGGIVTRPTMAMVGEHGPEAVIPLEKVGMGDKSLMGGTTNITMNVYSNDPDYISRQLARLIEQRKNAGY